MARAKRLHIHCDVVHPESGEVLAEPDDELFTHTPRAQHVLDVAKAHPNHYAVILDECNNTNIWMGPGPVIPVRVR